MKKNALNLIRILVVEPGKAPRLEEVNPGSWDTWYPLVDKTTELFQVLHLTPKIELLCDEEGRFKNMPLNVLVPAPAPPAVAEGTFVIDMTNGRGMKPGEEGIGYHQVYGTFILARRAGEDYVDLTDEDISKLKQGLVRAV